MRTIKSIQKHYISIICLISILLLFIVNSPIISYVFFIILIFLWLRYILLKELIIILCIFLVISFIGVVNIYILNNYFDLIIKGMVKLIIYALSSIAIMKLTKSILRSKQIYFFRFGLWLVVIFSLFYNLGLNLQSMPQMMTINILLFIELYSLPKKKGYFIIAGLLSIITTKKQILFSGFLFYYHSKKVSLKKWLVIFIILVLIITGAIKFGSSILNEKYSKRVSGFLSERFITPSPYGNMRLYLIILLLPDLINENLFFGYGLERFGSLTAFRSNRDIERNILNLNDFIDEEFSKNSLFGSVSADVGILTILMQTGLIGVFIYFLIFVLLNRNVKESLKIFIILTPYFLGGPVVYSIGFPVLVGITSALISVK